VAALRTVHQARAAAAAQEGDRRAKIETTAEQTRLLEDIDAPPTDSLFAVDIFSVTTSRGMEPQVVEQTRPTRRGPRHLRPNPNVRPHAQHTAFPGRPAVVRPGASAAFPQRFHMRQRRAVVTIKSHSRSAPQPWADRHCLALARCTKLNSQEYKPVMNLCRSRARIIFCIFWF
jgi:hypothetical protein